MRVYVQICMAARRPNGIIYHMTTPVRMSGAIRIRRVTALCLSVSMLAQTGCFTYRNAGMTALRPGNTVHLTLSDEGRRHLEPLLGGPTRSLTGQMQELVGDTAVVLIDELETMQGELLSQRRGRMRIPLADVASVQVRTVDRRGTWTLVAVAATTFAAVIVTAIKRAKASGKSGPGGVPGPPE